jgi:hypothetical protein
MYVVQIYNPYDIAASPSTVFCEGRNEAKALFIECALAYVFDEDWQEIGNDLLMEVWEDDDGGWDEDE